MKRNKLHSGQALLLILLSMAVVLTVVLSVVSKSVTDVAITTYEVDSLRAFSAAEAGIEDALADATIGVGSSYTDSVGSSTYDLNVESASPVDAGLYDLGSLNSGESATVWFVSHSPDGGFICDEDNPCTSDMQNINVCFGSEDTDETPAVEISIYFDDSRKYIDYEDYSNVKVKRLVYDSNSDRININNFDLIGSNVEVCDDYEYGISQNIESLIGSCISTNDCLIFAKIRLLYNDTRQPIAIGGGAFPSQGLNINSTGSDGEVQRKIQVFQPYPQPPEIFDNVLFTEGSI